MPTLAHHEAMTTLDRLRGFIGLNQRKILRDCCQEQHEEHAFFRGMIRDLAHRIDTMPQTYEQDGLGENAIVYLHYFGPGDWYITEKDRDPDGAGQVQAFGCVNLGYGPELGYISIPELLEHQGIGGVELDLYWEPKPLKDIKKARE